MNTIVAYINSKTGQRYNKEGGEIVDCVSCGNPTTMISCRWCDRCRMDAQYHPTQVVGEGPLTQKAMNELKERLKK